MTEPTEFERITLRNVSPYGDLDVPLVGATVEGGAEFDTDDRRARILLAQRDNFEPVSPAAQAIADEVDAEADADSHAAEAAAEGREPARNASLAVWRAYARLVAPAGADIDSATRTELIDTYGTKADG